MGTDPTADTDQSFNDLSRQAIEASHRGAGMFGVYIPGGSGDYNDDLGGIYFMPDEAAVQAVDPSAVPFSQQAMISMVAGAGHAVRTENILIDLGPPGTRSNYDNRQAIAKDIYSRLNSCLPSASGS